MKRNRIFAWSLLSLLAIVPLSFASEGVDQWLSNMQRQWAVNQYELTGTEQVDAFQALMSTAEEAVKTFPDAAELWVWKGIINSSYAGVDGGLGALKFAKTAKSDLEQAMALDETVLDGSAFTSLGALYYKVPGWPIGFGDDDKAETLLKKALTMNPDGIDSNYFYGDYLLSKKRYQQAMAYLEKAAQAAPRPGRELADDARHKEITAAISQVQKHIK